MNPEIGVERTSHPAPGLADDKGPGLRVAYLLLRFPEPSQTFVLHEVNTLVALGLEVRVYTLYGPRTPKRLAGLPLPAAPVTHLAIGALPRMLADLGILLHTEKATAARFLRQVLARRWRSLITGGEAFWAVLAGVHLARLAAAAGIGHLHAPWATGPATAAWVASRLSGIPFSFSARAYDLHPPDGALLEKLAAAAFVRTNTWANHRYLTELAPSAAHKVVNIYNGVSLAPRAAPLRQHQGPFRLLAMGRLVPKKGFPVLLAACRELAENGVDFRLTLAGDGPERARLRELVDRYGLAGRVRLPGFVPYREVPGLFQESDLFIMSSLIAPSGDRDGIPNVILEALMQEVPVVATRVSGIPEVVRPGETGWLAAPGAPENLADEMLAALQDPAEARRRALAGRDLVAREFDSRRNYARLKACFENRCQVSGARD